MNKQQRRIGTISGMAMTLALSAAFGTVAQAQQASIDALVIGRDGPVMSVRTPDTARQLVVLSDSTKAEEKGGLFGWSHKNLAITELTPGLSVHVEGTYDSDHRLNATKVVFSKDALKTAKQINAGVTPLNEEMAAEKDQLRTDRKNIEDLQSGLDKANQDIASANQNIQTNTSDITAAKGAIGATNGRIGALDQYETQTALTVNFRNGSALVSKKDKDALADFSKTAATTPGAMIEVQGYASKVGSSAVNQRLSSERASNVLTIIQQAGVPLTRILAPAAMGTVEQVADNHSRKGQAENRRVVVTLVVNKGITGGDNSAANQAPSTPGDTVK